jgi:hypothetical protein
VSSPGKGELEKELDLEGTIRESSRATRSREFPGCNTARRRLKIAEVNESELVPRHADIASTSKSFCPVSPCL